MNPARSPIVTSTLPSFCANASTSSTTSGSVTTVRTISTSFITGAGLKKCRPTTLLGRPVATAISVIDDEVDLGEPADVGAEVDTLQQRSLLGLAELAPCDGTPGGMLEMATPAGKGALVDLDGDHPQPRPGEYLSDTGTH